MRPQYDLQNPSHKRVELRINNQNVSVLDPTWLLREKILSAEERKATRKERTDIIDIVALVGLCATKSLELPSEPKYEEALKHILRKQPLLQPELERVLASKLPAVS